MEPINQIQARFCDDADADTMLIKQVNPVNQHVRRNLSIIHRSEFLLTMLMQDTMLTIQVNPVKLHCSQGTYKHQHGQSSLLSMLMQDTMLTKQVNQLKLRVLRGTYQVDTGQAACDDADAGHYVPTTGQSSQTACLAGTYQA